MLARVWGCRGSVAAPGPDTVRYGGNTSCVEVRLDERARSLVLDAGTGMRPLGVALQHDPPERAAHPAHAPPPRPSAGARVLPAVVPAGDRHPHLGTVVARAAASRSASRCTSRRRSSRSGSTTSRRTSRSTTHPTAVKIGSATIRAVEGHAPGPDGRLPHRGARPRARVPPRSRAVARRRLSPTNRRRG